MKRKYDQKYRSEWEQNSEFSSWLTKDKNNQNALCKTCGATFLSRIATIKSHAYSEKLIRYSGQSKNDDKLLQMKEPISEEVRKAELIFYSALAEHNIPSRAMDHLSDLFSNMFYDSEIAKGFSCKRTKSAQLAQCSEY